MKMKKTCFYLLLFLPLLMQAKTDQLTVILDWYINPDQAPLILAEEQGLFAKEHLKVRLIEPSDPNDALKLVAAKQADIGVSYQPDFTVAVSMGLPLVRFATLIDQPLNSLVVLKNGSIHQLGDLKGKTLAYSGTNNHLMLQTLLKSVRLTLKDVKLINAHYGEMQALLSHRVDGITGAMRNNEPIALKLQGQNTLIFNPEDYGMPSYDELILITRPDLIDRSSLKRFVFALKEASQYLKKHPDLSWSSFCQYQPALNTPLNKQIFFATEPYFAKNPATLDAKRYKQYTLFLQQAGLIGKMPELSVYARNIEEKT